MAALLGIVGSARLWGNSELLVRQVLHGAQAEGAVARMIRLTDLRLEPCTGCLRCVIGRKHCGLDDDMAWLVDTIQAADGLVLAAPTYFLGPAAILKLVLDRLLMVTAIVDEGLPPPRPAVTIATAGLKEWRGVTLPYLNALVAAFGYHPIESLTAIAPGPGEVLLNDGLMSYALDAGRRLARGDMRPASAPPNVCPICHCDSFTLKGNQAVCPICGQTATVQREGEEVHLRFDPVAGTEHRWTPEGLQKHMTEWVLATGPRFAAQRHEIKARRRPYREMDIHWLCPPPSAGSAET